MWGSLGVTATSSKPPAAGFSISPCLNIRVPRWRLLRLRWEITGYHDVRLHQLVIWSPKTGLWHELLYPFLLVPKIISLLTPSVSTSPGILLSGTWCAEGWTCSLIIATQPGRFPHLNFYSPLYLSYSCAHVFLLNMRSTMAQWKEYRFFNLLSKSCIGAHTMNSTLTQWKNCPVSLQVGWASKLERLRDELQFDSREGLLTESPLGQGTSVFVLLTD